MPVPNGHTRETLALARIAGIANRACFQLGAWRATALAMKCYCCLALLTVASLFARSGESDWNVNSRYTVESVEVQTDVPVSRSVRQEIRHLIGSRLNSAAVARLTARLTEELNGRRIRSRLERGTKDGRLRVVWEVLPEAPDTPASRSIMQYAAAPGFSAAVESQQRLGRSLISVRMGRDGESNIENTTGVTASFLRDLGDSGLRLVMDYGDYRQEWMPQTLAAVSPSDHYSRRRAYEPSIEWRWGDSWMMTAGASMQSLRLDAGPEVTANALVGKLSYHHLWISQTMARQDLQVLYSSRIGARSLDSGYVYRRHEVEANYGWKGERHSFEAHALWGMLQGQAPLFERFVLGNSERLRGWSKYDVAPAGGDGVAYVSVEGGYRRWRTFYDSGVVRLAGHPSRWRQSAGAGIRSGPMTLSLAFPFHEGAMIPVLIAALRF